MANIYNWAQNVRDMEGIGHPFRATYCECSINAEKMGATSCMGSSMILII